MVTSGAGDRLRRECGHRLILHAGMPGLQATDSPHGAVASAPDYRLFRAGINVTVGTHPAVPCPPALESARSPTHVEAIARRLPSRPIVRRGGRVGCRHGLVRA